MAGQIQMQFNSPATALAHMQTGRVRALAISTAARSSVAPGLPTIAESGLPGFEASIWQGIFVPARTPPEMIARLNREIVAVLNANDIKEQLRVQGLDSLPSTPEQFGAFVRDEIAKWAKVIKISGAKAE
jgi:tripartite-type tricarboxylate transporter receptor subunit TctC